MEPHYLEELKRINKRLDDLDKKIDVMMENHIYHLSLEITKMQTYFNVLTGFVVFLPPITVTAIKVFEVLTQG